jgi:outer membrane protein OmpA-like peptidoglycan-associated protein
MNSRIVILLATVFLSAAGSGVAQEAESGRIFLGPIAGFDAGYETSDVPVYGSSVECGAFSSGYSFSPSFGASLMLPVLFSDRFGISANLSGSMLSGELSAEPVDPVRIFDTESDELVELDREFRLKSRRINATLDLLARYSVTDRLWVAIGPSIGYQASTTFEQTDNVLGPGDYAFADGQREREMTGGPDLQSSAIQIGPVLNVSYSFPLSPRVLFLPELSLRANLTSPVTNAPWQRYAAGVRAALLFDITPGAEPPPPPPPPPDTIKPVVVVARKTPYLAASVKLYGVDEENRPLAVTTVRVNEILYRQYAPLIPAIFFDHDSTTFPSRYARLSPDQADTFSLDGLSGLDVMQTQRHMLDIIGFRMRDNASAKVTLYGSASKDENPGIAEARAEHVRKYLEEVWGINPSRVAVHEGGGAMQRSNESTEDGRADNRRVEIASASEAVGGPAITEQIIRDFNPPIVKMDPSFEAEAGLKRWTLTITQGTRTIAQYNSSDSGALTAPELTWHLATEPLDSALDPLVAELVVEDSTGATVTARNQVGLSLERRLRIIDGRIERNGDREQISYTLVAFNYNSAELGKQNEAMVRDIASAVREGAEVTITGYTDRIGEEQRNVELSAQRAAKVATALRARLDARDLDEVQVKAMGAGIETDRFENDYPEGRVLSRGVSVTVDQSAETQP